MKAKTIVAVVAVLVVSVAAFGQVTIETVPVGNPGNAGEVQPQGTFGAVSYDYNIGKYAVTAGQYKDFLNAVAKTDTYGLYNASMEGSGPKGCQITRHGTSGNFYYDFSGRPSGTEADWANRPVNYVSWYDTIRFANWMTNGQGTGNTETGSYTITGGGGANSVTIPTAAQRATWSTGATPYFLLTSEDEWYKAAYHDKNAGLAATYFNYPTSSNSAPSNDLVEPTDPGNNATFFSGGSYTIGSPYHCTEVGAHENSDSPYGTFDQGGNAWEWNEAVIGSYTCPCCSATIATRGLRGGSLYGGPHYLHASFRYHSDGVGQFVPVDEYANVGFRVSEVPEPATLSLLALLALSLPKRGGLALLRRSRRMA